MAQAAPGFCDLVEPFFIKVREKYALALQRNGRLIDAHPPLGSRAGRRSATSSSVSWAS
jgi:hypothetical protein